jgi:hypothetical protein
MVRPVVTEQEPGKVVREIVKVWREFGKGK